MNRLLRSRSSLRGITPRTASLLALAVGVAVTLLPHAAFAAQVGAAVTGSTTGGNWQTFLSTIMGSAGTNDTNMVTGAISFLLKPVATFFLGNSIFVIHQRWQQAQYHMSELPHTLVSAGGSGILLGGGALLAQKFIDTSSGVGAHIPLLFK